MNKERINGLDIFRFFCVILLFFYHLYFKLNVSFGILDVFIIRTSVCMTGFFMLSGFLLEYGTKEDSLINFEQIKNFYIRRYKHLLVPYFMLYIFYFIALNKDSLRINVFLFPIELIGGQMFWGNLGRYIHNTGTWFVSCFVFAYFMFPYLHFCIKSIDKKVKFFITILLSLMIMYIPVATMVAQANRESGNPLFRILEFTLGMCLASIKKDRLKNYRNRTFVVILYVVAYLVLILGVSLINKFNLLGDCWIAYDIYVIPIYCVLLYFADCINRRMIILEKFGIISYEFFFAQFFAWKVIEIINKNGEMRRSVIVVVSFVISIIGAILLHFCVIGIEKLANKVIRART